MKTEAGRNACKHYRAIIVEDSKLELKGTKEIFRNEIPEVEVVGTASMEADFWILMAHHPDIDIVLLDLGLGGSTSVGVDICRKLRQKITDIKILVFTGEILNEKLWVDTLAAGADGIILKTGELLTRLDVLQVLSGQKLVFNGPILEKIIERFTKSVITDYNKSDALVNYEIDEYDERMLRHLALGYTKEMISNLRRMPFGVKSLEKRQNELIMKLFGNTDTRGVNATRLVVRALELRILDIDNLTEDDE